MSRLTCCWNLFATIQRAHVTFTVEHCGKQGQSSIVYKVANSAAVISVSFGVDKQLTSVCFYSSHLCARDWNYKYLTGKSKQFLETCFSFLFCLHWLAVLEVFWNSVYDLAKYLISGIDWQLMTVLALAICPYLLYLDRVMMVRPLDYLHFWSDIFDYAMFCVT